MRGRLGAIALLFGILLLCPTSGEADFCPGHTQPYIPYAREVVTATSGGAAVPFTAATYNVASKSPALATVIVEGGTLRAWSSGATPTTTVGQLINTNTFWVCGYDAIVAFRAIAVTTTTTMTVEYSR